MPSAIESIINEVIRREGDQYTDHPSDKGGPTKFGITLKTLSGYRKRPCTAQDVQDLTRSEAYSIYYDDYVIKPRFDLILAHSDVIASELVDTGVLMGQGTASRFLQRSLNLFNRRGKDYADIAVDGKVGPATTKALESFLKVRGKQGERVLLVQMNCFQGTRLAELAEANETQEDFSYGWALGRVADQV